ncbi:MAG TPA: decaprenyl-phosphate phosphoribosyltransferase [Acidimicrobiales bacterium]|nr:decaprenyl-phosphate phosphoribosyltransferase [Acidimicrobiales bacterium]
MAANLPTSGGPEPRLLATEPLPDQPSPTTPAEPRRPGGLAVGLVRTARPRQWVKNVLVFAAPGAAGVLGRSDKLAPTLAAFAIFCLAASGTYFLNDALDAAADRLHPVKRHRPIASGRVPVAVGWVGAGVLMAGSAGLSALVNTELVWAVVAYLAITVTYSLWLKDEPILDIGAVASGFVIRAIAGGVAASVPLSDWFIIVASFGSLFMVAGKRYAEHVDLGEARASHRATLAHYSLGYLRFVRSVSAGVAITGYCLWAFEKARPAGHAAFWFELSIAPFVLAILRYALVIDSGGGGAPEEVILGNRAIQLLGLLWILIFALGVYGA